MSTSIVKINNQLPPTSAETIEKIRIAEERIREYFQIEFCTEHVFHAGMYARTVRIAANVVFTTVLVKRPTLLISHGSYEMLVGDEWVWVDGYNVLQGSAGRKQIYRTLTEVQWTMIFPTKAKTVWEAEAEFTDEAESLLSRQRDNDIVITGVPACLE